MTQSYGTFIAGWLRFNHQQSLKSCMKSLALARSPVKTSGGDINNFPPPQMYQENPQLIIRAMQS